MTISLSKVLEIPRLTTTFRRREDSSCRPFDGAQGKFQPASRFVFSSTSKTRLDSASAEMTDHATTSGLELTTVQALFNNLQQSFYHLSACDGNSLSL